ncbi:MAG TPA: sensor histidine kinase, partial [Acidimicrobiales bacterium]|nr:sensor histidine kinase [Acidimicrobiales bacterium]
LVENALVFSPPDQTVDIRGRARPDGYTLAVVDSGLGMPATDIAAANRRLAGAESFTIAPSRYLGHYVAGNLASRHGIGVRLDIGPGGGVTATVDLPASMLTNDDDAALASPVTDPHGMRALPAVNMPPPIGQEAQTSGQLAWEPAADGWRVDEPPVPAAAPFVPPTLVPPPPPAMPTRTQSGLVKRAPRNGTGATTAAEQLSSDLLDTLSRHTANLHIDQPAGLPDVPDDASRPGLWGRSGAPLSRPRVPEPPADWPAPGPLPPPPAGDWPAPGLTMPAAQPAAVPADPFDPDATLGVPAVGEGGETASGLTRRVRGAQLPRTQPLNLRRPEHGPERDDPGPAGAAGREAPERTAEQRRSADDVYGFLTAFTAGVKRGLHDDG